MGNPKGGKCVRKICSKINSLQHEQVLSDFAVSLESVKVWKNLCADIWYTTWVRFQQCPNTSFTLRFFTKQHYLFVFNQLVMNRKAYIMSVLPLFSVQELLMSSSCLLPGCPLSARRWQVEGFLWCCTGRWCFSPGRQSDPGASWQSEVELEEEKEETVGAGIMRRRNFTSKR